MLYQTIASVVLLATAANAASAEVKRQPYRMAVMAMPGQSLMRRDTSGYQPAQIRCKNGNSCAEACGPSFQEVAGGKHDVAHCFNPAAGQSPCADNSGNCCEAGFYCTHDSKKQTWCCPHDMDLASCAAAYTVTGLVAATAKPAPTSTSTSTSITSITSTITSTTSTTITTNSSTTSRAPTTTSAPCTTGSANITTTVAIVKNTTICTASAGKTTAWTALNSTIASLAPTQPSESVPSVTVVPSPASSNINAAAASGVSALLLLAAGFIALL